MIEIIFYELPQVIRNITFSAGSVALLGIITAEAFYPSAVGYTTFNSEISYLGATI